jgi:hypothetical protein
MQLLRFNMLLTVSETECMTCGSISCGPAACGSFVIPGTLAVTPSSFDHLIFDLGCIIGSLQLGANA